MGAAPDLRPRTVGEVLDAAFFVYRRYFGRLLMAATVVSIPTLIVAGITAEEATDALGDYFVQSMDAMQNPEPDPLKAFNDSMERGQRLNFFSSIGQIMQGLARGGAMAVMALAGAAVMQGRSVPGAWALVAGIRGRVAAVVVSQILVNAVAGMLMCCCMPLGIVALVLLLPIPAAIMLERGNLEAGLRKYIDGTRDEASRPLTPLLALPLRLVVLPGAMVVDGLVRAVTLSWHGITVARGTLFGFFLFLFVSFFVTAISSGVAATLQSWATVFWIQHYAEVIFLPVLGLAHTFWYFDLRTRREGLDLAPPDTLGDLVAADVA